MQANSERLPTQGRGNNTEDHNVQDQSHQSKVPASGGLGQEERAYGRVVLLYFELCQKIWGGSPATDQIVGGLETSEIAEGNIPEDSGEPSDQPQSSEVPETSGTQEEGGEKEANTEVIVSERRSLLNNQLHNYRQQKLKRKLPADAQLLECAQEDLQVKKSLVTLMEKVDDMFMAGMTQMSSNMAQLSSAVSG